MTEVTFPELTDIKRRVLDAQLHSFGMPSFDSLQRTASDYNDVVSHSEALKEELEELQKTLATISATPVAREPVTFEWDGVMPDLTVVHKSSKDVFGDLSFDIQVPFFEWTGYHPDVPLVDPDYIFREELLAPVLYALIYNERAWLNGHTGSGKTTFIEQVCARMNWPFYRINLDSDISRFDLIGKEALKNDGGTTISEWIDGAIPKYVPLPYVICFDEMDFVRPDVAYVVQSVLEGNGLKVLEDAGRTVKPHEFNRIVATANTNGQGDEYGIYSGARAQSLALLNRFSVWVHVPYLSEWETKKLISKKFPALPKGISKMLAQYVKLHQNAFIAGDVVTAMSPRTFLSIASKYGFYLPLYGPNTDEVLAKAIESTTVDASSSSDKSTLTGLIQRATGVSL